MKYFKELITNFMLVHEIGAGGKKKRLNLFINIINNFLK